MLVQEFAVSGVLMGGIGRPRVTCGGELDVGDIETGQDLNDAGDLLGLGNINGFDKAVSHGGTDDLDDQGILVTEIICVLGSACCLVECVHTLDALTYMTAHKMCLLYVVSSYGRRSAHRTVKYIKSCPMPSGSSPGSWASCGSIHRRHRGWRYRWQGLHRCRQFRK